jgi:hypothetical protein
MNCYMCLKTGKKRKATTQLRGNALCTKHAKKLTTTSFGNT